MQCPKCKKEDTKVIDSRSNGTTRRRRMCTECKYRFTTYEVEKAMMIGKHQEVHGKQYTRESLLALSKESKTLSDMGAKLGITKERVRQIAFLFGIREEILKILRNNRESKK